MVKKDDYCEIMNVAEDLLKCKTDPSEPNLCKLTNNFNNNYCGDEKGKKTDSAVVHVLKG